MTDPRDMTGLRAPVIEFFGLPGSGKSTVAREVHAILARTAPGLIFAPHLLRDGSGTPARVTAKLRLILADVARNSGFDDVVRGAFGLRHPSLRDRLHAAFRVATVTSLYGDPGLRQQGAVVDQGLLQALWSVRLRLSDDACVKLTSTLLTAAVSDRRYYVSVETCPEVCAARLQARRSKHSTLQQAWAAGNAQAWARAAFLQHDILGDFRAASRAQGTKTRLIVVDGTAKPADVAGQIVAAFLKPGAALDPLGTQPDQGPEVPAC